ncbi:MAG TPA: M56 family metallopeptidase [Pirellulaceae bacterium]|nr:M56 family metallopeptidase [Pirellulaceae bacterium]
MSLVDLLGHPAARLLTLALAHFLWQGALIAVLLAAAVQLLGVRRATSRYACSLAALAAMLICPLVTLGWLSLPGEEPVGWAVPTSGVLMVGTAHPTLSELLAPLQPVALAAWLCGVALFGTRLLAGAIGVARLRRHKLPLPLDLASLVERLGRRLKLDALPLVFVSRQATEAMAVGLLRPLVLIPAAWVTEMPLDMLEAVIAHELAHLRRRDLWVNLLQRLAETLLFYHPAIWWLSRRLRTERELCADELAVAVTGRRLEYAQALEQVAHRRQAEIRPALAAFMRGETNMRVLERVRNVLGLAGGERSRLWPVGIVALALPAVLWIAAAGWRSAVADEPKDGDKPAVKRDGDRPDGDKEPVVRKIEARFFAKQDRDEDGEVKKDRPRDGEVKKDAPRDGEVKKDATRRDGEVKKDAPRDGEVKKDATRRDGEVKKDAPRDGDVRNLRKVVAREGDAASIEELTALVKRLSAQVEKLQAEVSALRGGRGEANEKVPVTRRIKEGAGDKEALKEAIKREAATDKDAIKREAAEAIRARELKTREGGDKPTGENARRAAEAKEREAVGRRFKDAILKEVENKEAAVKERELIERKKALAAEIEKKAAAEKEAAAKKEKEDK